MIPLLIPIHAFLGRCFGGFLGLTGSLQKRIIYRIIPVYLTFAFIDWRLAILSAALSYLPLVQPFSHVPFQSSASLKDCLGMAAHGAFVIFCAVVPLTCLTWHILWAVPVGLMAGLAHFLGYKMDGIDSGFHVNAFTIPLINYPIKAGQFATSGAEWSEAFRGGVFGLAFAISYYLV